MRAQLLEHCVIVKVLLCVLDDVHHHLERLQRVFALRSLSGQHDRVCSVVYRVGNVRDLCSRRTRVAHHGIQHLSRRDDCLEILVALLDHHLLQIRHFLCRYLHSQVAARHHDAVRRTDDLVNIADTLRILDLRDDRDIRRIKLFQIRLDLQHTLCIADKGSRDKIDSLLHAEFDIVFVLLCDRRQPDRYVRDVDSLFLAQLSAVDYFAHDLPRTLADDLQADQSVVDQNRISPVDILHEAFIGNGNFFVVSFNIIYSKSKSGTGLQHNFLPVFQSSGTDLGPLGVQKDRCVRMFFLAELLEQVHPALLLCMVAVREIKSRHVHTVQHELSHHFLIICVRPHRTNHFRLLHIISPSLFHQKLTLPLFHMFMCEQMILTVLIIPPAL